MLDLCYREDADASVDMNLVMNDRGDLIEIQGTAEEEPFPVKILEQLVALGTKGTRELIAIQKAAIAYER